MNKLVLSFVSLLTVTAIGGCGGGSDKTDNVAACKALFGAVGGRGSEFHFPLSSCTAPRGLPQAPGHAP